MIGGTVVGIVDRKDLAFVKLVVRDKEKPRDATLVRVERGHGFMLGDQVWWQAGWVMWSRKDQFKDTKVRKVGCSEAVEAM